MTTEKIRLDSRAHRSKITPMAGSTYFGEKAGGGLKEFLTFDDVLLVPKRSAVYSRKDAQTHTRLSRNISLNIPLVSANMDTVTESEMAKAMARAGGIGIIHRFMSAEDEAREVERVKRSEGLIVEKPYVIAPDKTVHDVKKMIEKTGISGIVVTDEQGKVLGMITKRDILFNESDKTPVRSVMSSPAITAHYPVTAEKARKILHENRIEKLPVVDRNGILRGLITATDIVKKALHPESIKDKKGQLLVGASIGVNEEYLERTGMLIDAGADAIVVDIAHGHNERALEAVHTLRKKFKKLEIIAGNVATPQGTIDLIKAGADAVKVGIGPGSTCITRIVTGVGIPQLSAIQLCAAAAKKYGVPIIGDGGIRTSGDMSKAIAAGAETVMFGNLIAGTKESPGDYILDGGVAYKVYRGGASRESFEDKLRKENKKSDGLYRAPEGKAGRVPYRGEVADILKDMVAGFRSSMSYLGAKDIRTFQKNAEFVRITEAGRKESTAHGV